MTLPEVISNIDNTIMGKRRLLMALTPDSAIAAYLELNINELLRIRKDLLITGGYTQILFRKAN